MKIESTPIVDVEPEKNFSIGKQSMPRYMLASILYKQHHIVFLGIVALSTFLRLYKFPALPIGINQDEASAGYETYSLITHGTDRWGNKWPIYFPSWGSGQNALQSYLNMPFIKLFGLNVFAERLLPMLLGILTIVVIYFVVKKIYDVKTALIASFLLGTIPWHIMLSRWSLESNILPFFLLLGVWLLVSCYTSKHCAQLIPFSLIGLAIAFYAYGVSLIVIPLIIFLFWAFNIKTIWKHKISFMLSIVVFFVIASPFLLFALDNNILHRTPTFIKYFPFSVPLLPSNRLAQVTGQSTLKDNLFFALSGFNDGQPWNIMNPFLPLGFLNLPLAVIGIYFNVHRKALANNIFIFWLVATLPLFFLFDLNINRANAIFIPIVVFNAVGIHEISMAISEKKAKNAVFSLILVFLTLYNLIFCFEYFRKHNDQISGSFNANFEIALIHTKPVTHPNDLVYISDTVNLNYIYTLFYFKVDPVDFDTHSTVTINYGTYIVANYRNYYFHHDDEKLVMAPSYIALLRSGETINCKSQQVFYSTDQWKVERCFNR